MVEASENQVQPVRALAVSRLVPVKNFELLLKAWQQVAIELDIVGDGPLRSRLERLIHTLGLNHRVTLLGYQDDVFARMQRADIAVVTSKREGFGYVTLEALQSRCVVISTRCGVAQDLLPSEYLIDSSARDLARVLQEVIGDIDRARMHFKPVWDMAKRMTVAQMIDETIAVYDELLTI